MVTLPHVEPTPPDAAGEDSETTEARGSYGSAVSQIAVWIFWAVAAAFWAFSLTTAIGIMRAVSRPTPGAPPVIRDPGALQVLLMDVIGVVVLGLAMAYGVYKYVTRDRRIDPITEAATDELYDSMEKGPGKGGIDRVIESRRLE